ncbi:MAG TPA: 3-hydroxyacyl-CoA dehydrogenase [Burkholderiales bacterium]|jgi:3-hydroxyacyl-CoA dehydrogenase|nr:3-hydroxyacyl-CoA dehydrogenase [Burkholderiales bacterium]
MEKVAIIGTGLIGRAWAMVFARAGHPVRLYDSTPGATNKAIGLIREGLEELQQFGLIKASADTVMKCVSGATTLAQAVKDADYVQENTSERLEVKREVYRQLDEAAPAHCILASSTSTIQTSRFSEGLKGKHRCIVAHPVNPPHVVPIVEISPAPWTSPEVVARTRALHDKVGQVAIIVKKEVEGFILNRLQAALLLESWRLVKDDYVSVEDLDKCLRDGLGLRWSFMGPFETIDLNAPGGVADYAARYGPVLYGMMKDVRHEPWDDELVAKIERERRKLMPQAQHAEREAWRDRRLMALIAHKRKISSEE